MPNPANYENESDWMEACVPVRVEEGDERDQAVAVCLSIWRERKSMSDEAIVYYGGAVKALGDGRVGGYLVRYGSADDPDLTGEWFTPDTDFGPALESPAYYNHGLDVKLGKRVLGIGPLKRDEVGVWYEAQLELADAYSQAVYDLALAGKLGWSSGTAPHLVEKKNGQITRWPLGLDASLTPTPAEPRNAAMPLKAWAEAVKGLDLPDAEPDGADTPGDAGGERPINVTVHVHTDQTPVEEATMTEVKTMSEKNETPTIDWDAYQERTEQMVAGKVAELGSQIEGKFADITAVLDALAKAPALKDAGYVSPDSEKNERTAQKSFGDFLLAIRNGNHSRLRDVYGSVKALGEQSGTTGGYLVPEEFINNLMMAAMEGAVVRPLATVIQVGTNRGSVPALNHTTAPTAGKGYSAFAGGVCAYWTAEAGTLTSTDPSFEEIEYNINKLGGYTQVSNELIADSAIGIESLLSALFGRAIQAKEEYAFLRGTGAGEPLGIFASPCAQAVTTNANNTFAAIDAMNMLSQFQMVSGKPSSVTWVLHRGVIPDFYANMDVAQSGVDWVQPREGLPGTLLGWPMRMSEHMPAPNTDDVLLADMGAYLIFDRKGLEISYSEHAAFTSDQGTWRFIKRLDGQPWLSEVIYLADPGGAYTVSPFVYHDD